MRVRGLPTSVAAALMSLVAVVLTISVLFSTSASALVVEVAAGEVLELSETVSPHTILTYQFQVLDDQYLKVNLVDAAGYNVKDFGAEAVEGVHQVEASKDPKAVIVRLDNSASTFTMVRVSVHFRHSVNHNYAADTRALDPVEQKIIALSAAMDQLKTQQQALRVQQKNHRSTVEDSNERVLLWSIFQVVTLVAMSGFQLYFLKRFLERKSFI